MAGAFNCGLDNDHVNKRGSRQWDSALLCGGQSRHVGSQRLNDHCRKDVRGEAEGKLSARGLMGVQSGTMSKLKVIREKED